MVEVLAMRRLDDRPDDRTRALDAALAQIERAFGKGSVGDRRQEGFDQWRRFIAEWTVRRWSRLSSGRPRVGWFAPSGANSRSWFKVDR